MRKAIFDVLVLVATFLWKAILLVFVIRGIGWVRRKVSDALR